MNINSLQKRVKQHFKNLANIRENSDFPVFVIEHGLCEEELEQLRSALRSHCKLHSPRTSDWLLWVIYATEVGYDYTGDEYWTSFEEQTPGWEYSYRYKIKSWFEKFHANYNGVKPSGPWAEHFTIIAWPITHAILPVYLQHQFAKLLYDLRYHLLRIENLDARTIGRQLAANVYRPTSRFQVFLEQEEMIGRIALALLEEKISEDISEGWHLINPPTLKRIIADLDKVHESRVWLKETRQVVDDRFKGIGRGTGPHGYSIPRPSPPDTSRLAVRPKMLLRHTGGGNWDVLLDVPSFRSLSMRNKDVRSFLERTRFHLNGGDEMKPGYWLMSYRGRKGILQSWPDTTQPLIQFEHSPPVITNLLITECRLDSGPVWLFRISPDGTAREIKGRIVRPGSAYIVVTTDFSPQQAHECMSSCNLNCHSVKSFRLKIPSQVSTELTAWLKDLGLQVARTIRVWPAGLPGRGWDGEGSSEWLTTEQPCFGISHDHPVDAYMFRLNGGSETVIQTEGTGNTIFIQLTPLPVGTHTLNVKARRNHSLDSLASSSPAEGFVELSVREPEPWTPGIASHSGLIVNIDPSEPDLDNFWENKTSLSVIGPKGYTVTLTIKLETAYDKTLLKETVGEFNLPIKPDEWRRRFEKFQRDNENKLTWGYLEATTGTLKIDGETLGTHSIVFERPTRPLRWLTRRTDENTVVKLLDDTGRKGIQHKLYCCNMERPLKMLPLNHDVVMSGLAVEPPGSLFTVEPGSLGSLFTVELRSLFTVENCDNIDAHFDNVDAHFDNVDAVAVSTMASNDNEGSLNPKFSYLQRDLEEFRQISRLLEKWRSARLFGPRIDYKQQKIIKGILSVLYKMLYGPNWVQGEKQFLEHRSLHTLDNLLSRVHKNNAFAYQLLRQRSNFKRSSNLRIPWFFRVACYHSVCSSYDYELCKFALHYASQPHAHFSRYSSDELDDFFYMFQNKPALLRGARLLALVTAIGDA